MIVRTSQYFRLSLLFNVHYRELIALPTPVPLAVLFTRREKAAVILVVARVLRDDHRGAGGQAGPGAEEEEEEGWQQHLTLCLFTFLSVCCVSV